ncbi:hypothetical protein [Enterobacter hormaechei]|uniref:hypothetical protein n=1 Tax=Enterobacter hormaechei TaxID=158836 RepID=UPI00388F1FD8
MAISEKELLEAGFSNRDVDTLLERLSATGGTMQGFIAALSRRFRVSVWITVALALIMLVILIAGSRTHILRDAAILKITKERPRACVFFIIINHIKFTSYENQQSSYE